MPIRDWLWRGWWRDFQQVPYIGLSLLFTLLLLASLIYVTWFWLAPMVWHNSQTLDDIVPKISSMYISSIERDIDKKRRLWCLSRSRERREDYWSDMNRLQGEYDEATGDRYQMVGCDEVVRAEG